MMLDGFQSLAGRGGGSAPIGRQSTPMAPGVSIPDGPARAQPARWYAPLYSGLLLLTWASSALSARTGAASC
jgi:hypothetical protein